MSLRATTVGLMLLSVFGLGGPSGMAQAEGPSGPPLAAVPRVLQEGQDLPCQALTLPLVHYQGTTVRYRRPVQVHESFVSHLAEFEAVVADVAVRHYGRAPRRLRHLGGYNCRRMRRYPNWVSEHALGNALDLRGFDFGPARNGHGQAGAGAELPRQLQRAFTVDVLRHFRAERGIAARHANFLHDLTRALVARPDVFSVVLGPGWPGHENHLHLDAAPYRAVEVDLD